jgi:hypothetical protein
MILQCQNDRIFGRLESVVPDGTEAVLEVRGASKGPVSGQTHLFDQEQSNRFSALNTVQNYNNSPEIGRFGVTPALFTGPRLALCQHR